MKLLLTFVLTGIFALAPESARAASIAGFTGVVDPYYEGISLRFTINPTDTLTPQGVESFYVKINGTGATTNPFDGAVFVIDTFIPTFSPPGTNINPISAPDILGPDQIVIHFPKIESSTLVDLSVFFNKASGWVGNNNGTDFIQPFSVDLIVNPAFGTNPSTLGQQDFSLIATQDDYQLGYVGVPEPQSPLLLGLGLATCLLYRRRNG